MSYTRHGGYGSDWSAATQSDSCSTSLNGAGVTGAFLGDGRTGMLLHNSQSGALVGAEAVNGAVTFTPVGGFGSGWRAGHGKRSERRAHGRAAALQRRRRLVVGELINGQMSHTAVGGFGDDWHVAG